MKGTNNKDECDVIAALKVIADHFPPEVCLCNNRAKRQIETQDKDSLNINVYELVYVKNP